MTTETSPSAGIFSLPRSSPEAQGVSSSGIQAFLEAADHQVNTMHSVMLVRHGHVVAEGWWEPQTPDTPHVMHSLSKSFTSTAVGLAIADGGFDLNTGVLDLFPEDAPADPSANLQAMRVRDLLTMCTGHQTEPNLAATQETSWTQTFLAHEVPHKPGTHFLYNSPATYMLSAIVQKVSGQSVLDYLGPGLFAPLGIENPTWGTSPEGINFGGWGLFLRTEDIAKFGQLYLQKGRWHGKQLLPASWVTASTARQISTGRRRTHDWSQGYGFQFWRCRHDSYRADGARGQLCIVLPKQDAVIAITADTSDNQAVMNLVWAKLLPAMRRTSLRSDPEAESRLKKTLACLVAR